MKIRSLALGIVSAVIVAAMTMAAQAKDKFTIGYDIYWAGNSWSVQTYKEFQAEAARQSGQLERVDYVESEGKAEKQVANIEDLIVKKPDAIITSPINPAALIPVLKKAREQGIKVILLGATIKSDDYDMLVTVDDVDFGRVGGEWLAKKLNGKGKIIVLNGLAGISVSDDRWRGAKEAFDKNPGIQVLASVNADWDYAKGKLAVTNLLTAQPQIDGVWSQGGSMTLGAIEAFQAAKRPLVPMTGEDNNGFLKRWAELKPQGFDSIAVSKPTWLSSEALLTTLKLLKGEAVKRDNVLPVPVITSETLDKFVRPDLPDSFWNNTRLSDAEIKVIFQK